MSDDILDLDSIKPNPKKIKIHGKIIECYPLTVSQLVSIARLQHDLVKITNPEEILPHIKSVLIPFIPALKDDESLDFTLTQLIEIIKFAQIDAVPKQVTSAKDYSSVDEGKKK